MHNTCKYEPVCRSVKNLFCVLAVWRQSSFDTADDGFNLGALGCRRKKVIYKLLYGSCVIQLREKASVHWSQQSCYCHLMQEIIFARKVSCSPLSKVAYFENVL